MTGILLFYLGQRKMNDKEWIVAAWAAPDAVPGYTSSHVLVLISDYKNNLRIESIPLRDQTEIMKLLYDTSDIMNNAMRREAEQVLNISRERL
jgi:hypothetical protein